MQTQSQVSFEKFGAFELVSRQPETGRKVWNLIFDLPGEKVNKFSRAVMRDFENVLAHLESMGRKDQIEALVVTSGKPGIFIAGADIELIQAARTAEEAEALSRMGQKLLDRWEDLPFPTVVASQGATLGGGCEFSLASTAIVLSNDPAAKIGLPEVLLGVIPGMGGCVRMPRKIGLANSLDLILSGKSLDGTRAAKMGLIEACLPKENFHLSAFQWTARNLSALRKGVRLGKEPRLGGVGGVAGKLLEKTPMGRSLIFGQAKKGVLSKTRGHYPAPLEVIAVLQDTGATTGAKWKGTAREKRMVREAQGFGKCAATDISKNLIRLFFLTEAVKKSNGLPPGTELKTEPVSRAAVLGAGVMGGGIAQLFADKGVATRMKDLNTDALALGVLAAKKIFDRQLKRKRIDRRQFLQKMNLIAPVVDYSGFGSSQVVVEAIVEKLEIKQRVFQELEGHVREDTVIASNTSSLPITSMQAVMKRPERFVGMHFFNPVHRMPLVEVIRGEKSNDRAVATIFNFSKQLGKTPIVVKDAPGFLVNRLLMPYLNEATWMLAESVPIDELDQAMLDFGMPMGPMELIDEVGVDVGDKVAHILFDAFGARMSPAPFNTKITGAQRLGKKSGAGLYVYEDGGKKKRLDPEIYSILGVTPQKGALPREEIVERCVLPMINEAARCLEEGIVATASEVDLGMIMGTGFPPFRGGLLRYADTLGPQQIVDRLRKYQERFGARFEPSSALEARARSSAYFYSNER